MFFAAATASISGEKSTPSETRAKPAARSAAPDTPVPQATSSSGRLGSAACEASARATRSGAAYAAAASSSS